MSSRVWWSACRGNPGPVSWCFSWKHATSPRYVGFEFGRGGYPHYLWSLRVWLWLWDVYVVIGR